MCSWKFSTIHSLRFLSTHRNIPVSEFISSHYISFYKLPDRLHLGFLCFSADGSTTWTHKQWTHVFDETVTFAGACGHRK